jgi:hypothetical protein
MAKDSWHAAAWRDKLYVWIAPPGWRPADVVARFPKPPYDPYRDFARFDPPRSLALSLYVLAQFVAIMVANSHFLALLPKQSTVWNLAYFGFILISLVTLGGVLENRREWILLEGLRMTCVAGAVLAMGAWFGNLRDARVVLAVAAFAVVSVAGLWLAWRQQSSVSTTSPIAAANLAVRL